MVGDVSMQNWGHGNDMADASLFLPTQQANATVWSSRWTGGVNLTALRMAEDRAYGSFHALVWCSFFDRNLHSRSAIEFHAFAPLEALPCA